MGVASICPATQRHLNTLHLFRDYQATSPMRGHLSRDDTLIPASAGSSAGMEVLKLFSIVYVLTQTHKSLPTCTQTSTHTHTHAHARASTHPPPPTRTHTHTHSHARTHAPARTHAHTHQTNEQTKNNSTQPHTHRQGIARQVQRRKGSQRSLPLTKNREIRVTKRNNNNNKQGPRR